MNLAKLKEELISVPWDDVENTMVEIIHHIIAHEIHHIGQLPIWGKRIRHKPCNC